jgi:hypothetical protein
VRRLAWLMPLFVMLGACSSRQALFVVLPNPDGSAGAVTVSEGGQSVMLDQPYAASEERSNKLKAE